MRKRKTVEPPPGSPTRSQQAVAPTSEKLAPLPLGPYYSLVPLHLGFSLFAVLVLPSRTLSPSSPAASSPGSIARLVQPLIGHPVRTLAVQALALFCCQLWWTRYLRTWRKEAGKTVEQVRREKEEARRRRTVVVPDGAKRASPRSSSPFLSSLLDSMIVTIPSTVLIHVALILHGAPFFARSAHTLLLATLLSLHAVFPTAFAIGWNQGRERATWVRMFSAFEPRNDLEIALLCPAIASAVGTWLGAVPIPLDWDRPWQRYPTTCVIGCSLGHALGVLVAMAWIAVRSVTVQPPVSATPPASPKAPASAAGKRSDALSGSSP